MLLLLLLHSVFTSTTTTTPILEIHLPLSRGHMGTWARLPAGLGQVSWNLIPAANDRHRDADSASLRCLLSR
jgi:hypothetical protein